jgi:hypothetical protein
MELRAKRLRNRVLTRFTRQEPISLEFMRLSSICERLLEIPITQNSIQLRVGRKASIYPPPTAIRTAVWKAVAPQIPQSYVDVILQPNAYLRYHLQCMEGVPLGAPIISDSSFVSEQRRRAG